MATVLHPWQILVAAMAGWIARQQDAAVAAHYHIERNHQRLNNQLIEPGGREASDCGVIESVQRLGGMLRFYRRAAA